MVGIVVVSHSKRLAEGVAELATQMTQGKVKLSIAAGIDDPDNPIGTDTIAVMAAIEQVFDDSGVVVLMDLGSAILSAEMALDLIDPVLAEKVTMISAPIVEGTMAASVAAAAGLPINDVINEARASLVAKSEHLGDIPTIIETHLESPSAGALKFNWLVKNPNGIHARPAAAIVSAIAKLDTDIWLKKANQQLNAKSLNNIAKLGIRCGDEIQFLALGKEAKKAIQAITELATNHFGEDEQIKTNTAHLHQDVPTEYINKNENIDGTIFGISVNGGVITAPAFIYVQQEMPLIPERKYDGFQLEMNRINTALNQVSSALTKLAQKDSSGIFEAHLMMVTDSELMENIAENIERGMIAEQAWMNTIEEIASNYRHAENEYMRERENDVYDIAQHMMKAMVGDNKTEAINIIDPSILFASDLMPSEVAKLDTTKVLAICLENGGKTSHSAILAKSMGIPTIVKASKCLQYIHTGEMVTIDGFSGSLRLEPSVDALPQPHTA